MRANVTYLNVPYRDKDEAKALGAWWDPDLKKWFVPQGRELEPFERWMSSAGDTNRGLNQTSQIAD